MRDDVEAPSLEIADFVLRLADHDLDDRAFHPLRLPTQPLDFSAESLPRVGVRGGGKLHLLAQNESLDLSQFHLPSRLDTLEHPRAGDLVDAHQHRFPAMPAGRAMFNELPGQLLETV